MQTNTLTTLLGGETYTATRIDGTTEPVFIRQLPVKIYPVFLEAIDDEPRMVDILCDKPAGWSETMSPESFDFIATRGDALNQDFFYRWAQRRLARQEKLVPGITDRMLTASRLPNTSPNSPSSPA
ncbi:MAG TPA: hypothetical protein VGQ71_01185 [Terriglobales bacterium]|nr:hypothetical protein [Terriglobales bacterium]